MNQTEVFQKVILNRGSYKNQNLDSFWLACLEGGNSREWTVQKKENKRTKKEGQMRERNGGRPYTEFKLSLKNKYNIMPYSLDDIALQHDCSDMG